ncbi:MAG: hypothetical protein JXA15_13500 [Spirochaetales bacterium]|nr:hypothetical protein [Spirochaetales bacterium]
MEIVLLSGERGSGKTTTLVRLADAARLAGLRPGGVLQPGVFDGDGEKTGSTWLDAASGASGAFGSKLRALDGPSWKDWSFSAAGLDAANRAVLDSLARAGHPVLVDEIGPLELRAGSGLSPSLRALEPASRPGTDLASPAGTAPERPLVVVAVRTELAAELADRLGAERVVVLDPACREAAFAELAALLAPGPAGPGRSGDPEAS